MGQVIRAFAVGVPRGRHWGLDDRRVIRASVGLGRAILLAGIVKTRGSTLSAGIPSGMMGSMPWMAALHPPPTVLGLDSSLPPDKAVGYNSAIRPT